MRRVCWSVACTLIPVTAWLTFAAVFRSTAATAQEAGKVDLKPQNKSVVTKDGLTLYFTYLPSPLQQDAPVVVLLHMEKGNRLDWTGPFLLRLQQQGYAVVVPDLRMHGQSKPGVGTTGDVATTKPGDKSKEKDKDKDKDKSKSKAKSAEESLKPADYQAMVFADLEALKGFILEENQAKRLNMNKMALIGAEMGAVIAVAYAEVDWNKKPHNDGPVGFQTPRGQDVRALVLLSPQTSVPGVSVSRTLSFLRNPTLNVACLIGYGTKDKEDKGQAKKIYQQLITPEKNKDRMSLEEYASAGRGTELIGKGLRVEDHILFFLDLHVKKAQSEWRDRESKLGRKKS